MLTFVQKDFSGGMNLFDHDVNLRDNEYGLSYNVRNRASSLDPVKEPLEDSEAPIGLKQGLYAFDQYLLLFVNGFAYYKQVDAINWTQINNIFVDPFVDYIYTQAVPASTFNFVRLLKDNAQISGTVAENTVNAGVQFNSELSAGLVVQDGINQGWLILSDAAAFRLNRYDEWNRDTDREYVPIMKQMVYHPAGILFGLSPDGTKLFRSVSGRPIDFVVAVDINGDKGGNADTTSYAVSFNRANFLGLVGGGLLIGTDKVCFPISLNYDRTIFQEPTFSNPTPFSVGIVNQFSFIETQTKDIDGNVYRDYGFIDFDGIRSFNASFASNEGRNSDFTSKISSALVGQKQVINASAAITFNDYSFFAMKSNHGHIVAIYDNKRQQWVSFDRFIGTKPIKQFVLANQSLNPTLYTITEDKVYKLYSGSNYLQANVLCKANTSGQSIPEIKTSAIRAVFQGNRIEISATAVEVVDGSDRNKVTETLNIGHFGITYPVGYPCYYNKGRNIENIIFQFDRRGTLGWKIAPRIKWKSNAKLLLAQVDAQEQTTGTPFKQQSKLKA